MEIKETDTLLVISIIGLLLLGNIGSAAAVQFDPNSSVNFTNSTNCEFPVTPEAKIKNVIVLIPDGCSQSVETLLAGIAESLLSLTIWWLEWCLLIARTQSLLIRLQLQPHLLRDIKLLTVL